MGKGHKLLMTYLSALSALKPTFASLILKGRSASMPSKGKVENSFER